MTPLKHLQCKCHRRLHSQFTQDKARRTAWGAEVTHSFSELIKYHTTCSYWRKKYHIFLLIWVDGHIHQGTTFKYLLLQSWWDHLLP